LSGFIIVTAVLVQVVVAALDVAAAAPAAAAVAQRKRARENYSSTRPFERNPPPQSPLHQGFGLQTNKQTKQNKTK